MFLKCVLYLKTKHNSIKVFSIFKVLFLWPFIGFIGFAERELEEGSSCNTIEPDVYLGMSRTHTYL